LAIGAACLLFTRRIQAFNIYLFDRTFYGRLSFCRWFVRSNENVWSIRIAGLIAVAIGLLLLWVLIKTD
jgi:hypothetical protein